MQAAQERSALRFSTAGSVDDGKSTLIGRLLFDTKGAYEDQIEAVKKSKVNRSGREMDLSLLTDGLRAEREQGITIDVAYRFFATPQRRFRIADTPGHEQYTRNMATGASTSDAAVILVDALKGVSRQTLRHATISYLLGIEHLIFAINKMDAVGWSEDTYGAIRSELERQSRRWAGAKFYFLPVSALDGDNVAWRSQQARYYNGPSLLELLETLEVSPAAAPFRFPVQYVTRPGDGFRGFAGRVASGAVAKGDEVLVLPRGRRSRVKEIVTFDGSLAKAGEGESITLVLEDEIDISRGDMLVAADERPALGRRFAAELVWMAEEHLEPGLTYLLRAGTKEVYARVVAVEWLLDPESGEQRSSEAALGLNDIARVVVETTEPLPLDPYRTCRETGSFILIHPRSNRTIAAGMVVEVIRREREKKDLGFALGPVTAGERVERYGHLPAVLRSQDPDGLERALFEHGALVLRWAGAVPAALEEAGALVISESEGLEVPVENPLAFLESAGILLPRDDFSGGEGI
ncbi:MAG: GTP-binding protein [Bryobacter sp.]|nr:GTP-binding protein [Bryobacter sp.]